MEEMECLRELYPGVVFIYLAFAGLPVNLLVNLPDEACRLRSFHGFDARVTGLCQTH